jgi:hypothetical protein
MPCNDGGPREDTILMSQDTYKIHKNIEAMLCGIAAVLESNGDMSSVLDKVDWSEVGVSKKKFKAWWGSHKALDAARKAEEELIREHQTKIDIALAKLTNEERELLGLRDR